MGLTETQRRELLSLQREGETWNSFAGRAGVDPKTLTAWVDGSRKIGPNPGRFDAAIQRLRRDAIESDTEGAGPAQKLWAVPLRPPGSVSHLDAVATQTGDVKEDSVITARNRAAALRLIGLLEAIPKDRHQDFADDVASLAKKWRQKPQRRRAVREN